MALIGEQKLGCDDMDFKPNLFSLFSISTEIVFRLDPSYAKKETS